MKSKLLIVLAVLLLGVGCKHHESRLSPGNGGKIMMQTLCCAPGYITPGNESKCDQLINTGDPADPHTKTINGVLVYGIQPNIDGSKPAACVNLDERPFWGQP
jgi:hypothetical protein